MRLRDRNDNPDLDASPLPDVRDQAWHRMVEQIHMLCDCPEYVWARTLLGRMQATVERTHTVTPKQIETIERIRAQERTPSRNYDAMGYRRRWR